MRLVLDLEANGLEPTKIWCAVTKDIDDGTVREYLGPDFDRLRGDLLDADCIIGHNIIEYDYSRCLGPLLGINLDHGKMVDTLVVSRLTDFSRDGGHSLESFGAEYGLPKVAGDITDWSVYDPRMLLRCHRDVLINARLFLSLERYLKSPRWAAAVRTEFDAAFLAVELHQNGFPFNQTGALNLRGKIQEEVEALEEQFQQAFPPRSVLLKEITPRSTKHGTIHRGDFRWAGNDLTEYSVGAAFSRLTWEDFNPGSPKQRVDRLWDAGWKPVNKTKGYIEFLRSLPRGWKKMKKQGLIGLSAQAAAKLTNYERYGFVCDEENLRTLPDTAPPSAKSLVRWLLLSSRVRRLDEWLGNYNETTGCIHGSFNSLGAWTGRFSHSAPNQGNIPKFDVKQPDKTPYSDVMRALFRAGDAEYLVGVDAEGIQLRIYAHYINDKEFINGVIAGRKEDATDPHSLNRRALGEDICQSRDDAKTFIYAFLLGAGVDKVAAILGCSREEARQALKNFVDKYEGLRYIRRVVIPEDASRGYFRGFDGRYVPIYGADDTEKAYYAMAGYLQSGESVIMKTAMTRYWHPRLVKEKIPFKFTNFVHDEWQVRVLRDIELAKYVAGVMAESIKKVGEDFELHCPMAGSIMNSHGELAIGDNWMETH